MFLYVLYVIYLQMLGNRFSPASCPSFSIFKLCRLTLWLIFVQEWAKFWNYLSVAVSSGTTFPQKKRGKKSKQATMKRRKKLLLLWFPHTEYRTNVCPTKLSFIFFLAMRSPVLFLLSSYSVLAYNTSAAWPFNNSNCFHATESRLHTRRRRTSTMGRFLEHRMPRTLMGESHFASLLRFQWIEIAHTRRGRAVIIGAHTRPTRQFESIPCSTVQNYNSYIIRCRQYKQQQQWSANTNKRSQTDMAILRLQTFPIK